MKLQISRRVFEKKKYLNIDFHENPFWWEPSCSTRTDERTYMTKLIVAFRNIANAPKIMTFL